MCVCVCVCAPPGVCVCMSVCLLCQCVWIYRHPATTNVDIFACKAYIRKG